MDYQQQSPSLNYFPPAQLIVGDPATTSLHAQQLCRKAWCSQHGCQRCYVCQQINEHQFHSLLWLRPERTYTLEQLEDIFAFITLARMPHEPFFFILEQAELLNAACANKLLKVMEEPPIGYHFLLLTERPQELLPTIRSRCIVQTLTQSLHDSSSPLLAFFTAEQAEPAKFLQVLEKISITEHETSRLLDELLRYFLERTKDVIRNNTSQTTINKRLQILQQAYNHLPMPGGSKLFWKNLYLQCMHL